MGIQEMVMEDVSQSTTDHFKAIMQAHGMADISEEAIEAMIDRISSCESSMQEELGISDEALEAMYFVGYTKYRNKRYKEAADIFLLIVSINPYLYKAVFALASAKQMLREYQAAVFFYYLAAPLEPENPMPLFHVAECFLALKERELAKDTLKSVTELKNVLPEHESYIERAKVVLENLG